MEVIQENKTKFVWAVLCQNPNGRSEVIKITDYEDADRTVQDNPSLYFKSGPIAMSA